MLDLEDIFETLGRMKEHLDHVVRLQKKMRYWMSDEETAMMNEIVHELHVDVAELEHECLKNDICPDCGGDLRTETWTDPDCGITGTRHCESCGKEWR